MSSAISALTAPRAAARRCRTSAQCSSSFRPRRTLSNWPMIFLVRLTRSSFSRETCVMAGMVRKEVEYKIMACAASARTFNEEEQELMQELPHFCNILTEYLVSFEPISIRARKQTKSSEAFSL